MVFPLAPRNSLISIGERRNIQVLPATLFEHMSDEILGMQTLGDMDDDAVHLRVAAGQQGGLVPPGGLNSHGFRSRLFWAHCIIENYNVSAAARERSPCRGCKSIATHCCQRLKFGILRRVNFHHRKNASVPIRTQDRSEIRSMFCRKIVAVTDANDLQG